MIVLDVHALPRGERSRTRRIRDACLASILESHADARIVSLDLAADYKSLPAFDEWDIQAKYEMAYGDGELDAEAAERWQSLTRLTDQLHLASVILITAPMWNLSVPWHLKRWIDAVVQARLTFEYTDGAYRGLLGGRAGVLITSRDSRFDDGSPLSPMDFQMPYLRTVLAFMGVAPVHEVVAEPMVAEGREVGEAALEAAIGRARELGRTL